MSRPAIWNGASWGKRLLLLCRGFGKVAHDDSGPAGREGGFVQVVTQGFITIDEVLLADVPTERHCERLTVLTGPQGDERSARGVQDGHDVEGARSGGLHLTHAVRRSSPDLLERPRGRQPIVGVDDRFELLLGGHVRILSVAHGQVVFESGILGPASLASDDLDLVHV